MEGIYDAVPRKFRLFLNEKDEFRVLFVSDFHAPSDRDWDERLPRALAALLDETKPDLCANLGDFLSDGIADTPDRFRRYADVHPESAAVFSQVPPGAAVFSHNVIH